MPLQLPQVGQLICSNFSSCASLILPAACLPTASNTVIRSLLLPSSSTPAIIGPPEMKIVGMLTRAAPISIPGVILSQFGIQIIASKQCAAAIVSTESAISSRDGSE